MKLILLFSLFSLAYAHLGCGGDCLRACRSCGNVTNDGEEEDGEKFPFEYGANKCGDCIQAVCKDKKAVMIVDGYKVDSLVCFQNKWHFGFPEFLEETNSAICLTPGNTTCAEDATLKFEDGRFQCICNGKQEDRTEEFERDQQVCSNCNNKKLNIILLFDNSGSMNDVLDRVKAFAHIMVQFFKVADTGNRVAVMTSANSYTNLIGWDAESYDRTTIDGAIDGITIGDQSFLGSGMEAVKAMLVQPAHDNDNEKHVLIVFTDGSVKHNPSFHTAISKAANNLEELQVDTYVVATNQLPEFSIKQAAVANSITKNVFAMDESNQFEIADTLQKIICA